eukprot:CAMPEP_0119406426 /NCGR_PEP_ID=MMETSP1335-20130426/755_1 /TAXON_ID=259385 /ORGANISM="Chrysoculter rhomboideus, Strain RCC1486" /LENGTH=162 /DNA_ID=CAMNT_0007430505 /DNA_START=65 /DNA_END=553 /DNA_ORIENTATION=+
MAPTAAEDAVKASSAKATVAGASAGTRPNCQHAHLDEVVSSSSHADASFMPHRTSKDGLSAEEEMDLTSARDRLQLSACCVSCGAIGTGIALAVRIQTGTPIGFAALELALAALLLVWTALCTWTFVLNMRLRRGAATSRQSPSGRRATVATDIPAASAAPV